MHYLLNPTWRCPGKWCEYCWVGKTIGDTHLFFVRERWSQDWINAIHRDKVEKVDLAGGEPFVVDWITELIVACPDTKFGISTNGLMYDGYEELCVAAPENVISINVSYHPRMRKTYGRAYDALWRKAIWTAKEAELPVHANIVDYEDNVELAKDAIRWLDAFGLHYAISPYEDMDTLKDKTELGLCCKGGISHLVVAPNGDAWPCLTTLRSPYSSETCLGNWLDGEVDLSKVQQPCYLNCTDYYVLDKQHEQKDMWGLGVRPCE